MKKEPYSDQKIKEIIEAGRTFVRQAGGTFGDNFRFFVTGYLRAVENDVLEQCYETALLRDSKNEQEQEKYYESLEKMGLANVHGIWLMNFMGNVSRQESSAYFQQYHKQLIMVAELDSQRNEFTSDPNLKSDWDTYNTGLEALAVGLMKLGQNPLGFRD